MPLFTYKIIDKNGKPVVKSMEAVSKEALANDLSGSGSTLISISEKKGNINLTFIDDVLKKMSKVRINDLVMLLIQLSNMLDAGMALPAALSTLAEQTENKKLKDAISDISDKIKQGKNFSESLAEHGDIFSSLFVNLVAAGETAGNLDAVLERLSKFIEHEAELKQKISGAMMYPMILIIAGLLVVSFVVTTMLPPFVKIFLDAGVPLPLPTKILYGLNLIIRAYWIHLIVFVIAARIAYNHWSKTPDGKMISDKFKLKLPVWGDLLKKVEIARLCRTLSALLSSGVPMLQAIAVTEKTIGLAPIASVIKEVGNAVSKGRDISSTLKGSEYFPPMPVHMIAVGEETGTLEVMLNKVADFYEIATDYAVKKLTTLLEPMFLVIIGGLVGFIFASILLPIFQMVKVLKQ